jgi:hypothetical protein
MGRRLTERKQELRAAEARLKEARRAARAHVAAARSALDELSRCDWCGCSIRFPSGAELQLCRDCEAARLQQLQHQAERDRVALLAAHGYDAKGRKIQAADAARASATPR